jgi:hypothetical protein
MMWTKYTGVLLWKTQNPWPGLRGQMYDFLLDQTGAFFGLRSACESVHVQLNLRTYNIEVQMAIQIISVFRSNATLLVHKYPQLVLYE